MAGVEERHVVDSDAWSAWLDGELSEGERARVEAHLAVCEECRRVVESWRSAQQLLASYAPQQAPGDAEAFWARLAPSLAPAPRPRPDPALYLAPAALAVTWALVQGVTWLGVLSGPLGGWRWLAASRLFVAMRDVLSSRWAVAVPPGWAGSLLALAGSAAMWTFTAALAVLYAAWLVLWLRRPLPAAEPGTGG